MKDKLDDGILEGRSADLADLKLYTLKEIAPVLGLSYRTLQAMVSDGRLQGVKIGNRWKVSRKALEEYYASKGDFKKGGD